MSIHPSDPATIIAGIRQFGLASDGSDLRDLEAATFRLQEKVMVLEAEIRVMRRMPTVLALSPREQSRDGGNG